MFKRLLSPVASNVLANTLLPNLGNEFLRALVKRGKRRTLFNRTRSEEAAQRLANL
jgi:hypothetical protein